MENIQDFKGIDTSRFRIWQLYTQPFFYEQAAYERGGMVFVKQISPAIDTLFIYKNKMKRNNIASFVGLDEKGVFHVALDANNNADFSDEQWYQFDKNTSSEDYIRTATDVICKFDYFDGKALRDTSLRMELSFTRFRAGFYTEKDYNNDGRLKDKFQLFLIRLSYKSNTLIYQGKRYFFSASDEYYNLYRYPREYSLKVKKLPVEANENYYKYYPSSGELVRLNNSVFRIPMKVTDTLTLSYVGEAKNGNASIGKPVPSGIAMNLLTGKKYSLGGKTGKYTLIDFWASWCGPCIRAFPALKSLKSKYSPMGIQVLSLAVDDEGNRQKLIKLIAEHGLDWPQLYMDAQKEGKTYLNASRTQAFPTTLLIDPNGIVIYRGTSEQALREADTILRSIFFKKQ